MTTSLRARVTNGRIVLDEPTYLPEGTVLELVPGVEVDALDEADRQKLHAAIRKGLEQGRAGAARPVERGCMPWLQPTATLMSAPFGVDDGGMVGTELSARAKRLNDSTHQVRVRAGEKWLTRRDFWLGLETDKALRATVTEALRSVPFEAFFWETVPLSPERMDAPFECVLVDAPTLASNQASPEAFADHFASATASVVSFPNLAGDSVLVVPRPTLRTYGHLAAFLRQAPDEQTDALWTRVGTEVAAWLGARPLPLWVSTSGLAVPWLHVRLDARPKYYGFEPWKRPEA
jgi:hypothetical protein